MMDRDLEVLIKIRCETEAGVTRLKNRDERVMSVY